FGPFSPKLETGRATLGDPGAAGSSRPLVDPVWRRDGEVAAALAFDDLPAPLVDHPVMPMAEQYQVRQVGLAAIDPMLQVVALAPARRPVAAGPAAVPVAVVERLPSRPFDSSFGAADVDHHRVGVEQDPGDVAVAGEPLDALARDRQRELEVGRRSADPAEQGLERGGDLEVGPLAAP